MKSKNCREPVGRLETSIVLPGQRRQDRNGSTGSGDANSAARWNVTLADDPEPSRESKPVILVPTDLSPASLQAAEHGLQLAAKNGALLLLVHAVHLNLSPYGPANPRALKGALCQEAMEKTAPLMRRAEESGVAAVCAIEEGAPWSVIVKLAMRWKASMIVLGTCRRGFFSRLFARGTTERVLRGARCPVMVCPAL
jgi:nucleotide-binding universal stress UspA family protein